VFKKGYKWFILKDEVDKLEKNRLMSEEIDRRKTVTEEFMIKPKHNSEDNLINLKLLD